MRLSKEDFEKLRKIKIVLFDLNGVLIESSDLNRICSPDFDFCFGNLVSFFKSRNIKVGVITANKDEKIKNEFERYGVDVGSASIDKEMLAKKILTENNLDFENLLYAGDEVFDFQLLKKAGFSVAPSNASRSVKRIADYVSDFTAGEKLMNDIKNLFLLLDDSEKTTEAKSER